MPRPIAGPSCILVLLAACSATPALAAPFTWSTNSEPSTMDPHAAATAPVLGFLNNIYEGLVRRGPDMALQPSLATAWEPIGSEGWRFTLRDDVTFHDGAVFDAEDVVFSFERASSEASDRFWMRKQLGMRQYSSIQ